MDNLISLYTTCHPSLEPRYKRHSILKRTSTGAAKFIARASKMGERKMVIYIPLEYHADVVKYFKGKQIKVTLEEAV